MTRFALLSSLLKILVLALQEVSDGACYFEFSNLLKMIVPGSSGCK